MKAYVGSKCSRSIAVNVIIKIFIRCIAEFENLHHPIPLSYSFTESKSDFAWNLFKKEGGAGTKEESKHQWVRSRSLCTVGTRSRNLILSKRHKL